MKTYYKSKITGENIPKFSEWTEDEKIELYDKSESCKSWIKELVNSKKDDNGVISVTIKNSNGISFWGCVGKKEDFSMERTIDSMKRFLVSSW